LGPPKIIILGGGIAGLSAAHELIERQFDVEIYELMPLAGGKARSFGIPGTGTNGRRDLPGEHGFRFFPRFYRHVTDTMSRIPYGDGTVADNLVDTTRVSLARFGRRPIDVTARSPRSINDVRVALDDIGRFLGGDLDLTHDEIIFFASKVWQIVTSCRERRMNDYEKIGWWEFIGAEQHSPAYQKLLGHGITRSLVAAKADTASTKTIGNIFIQLLFDIVTPGPSTDRVLCGPTNEVWIDPWLKHLVRNGVRYQADSKATAVTFDGSRIRAATIQSGGSTRTVEGDYFILAMPIEDVIDLITPEMTAVEPALGHLSTLDDITEWMNGIQIYLKEDVPIAHGHTIYVDSPWALTSISQAQFWKDIDVSTLGDGAVRGIISVDISEWGQPGLNGKTARQCTAEEIKSEVWEQLKRSLNYGDNVILKDEQLHHWSLDPSIRSRVDGSVHNEEPLLVNLVDTWKLRPEAVTRIPNLFLASDYVRTGTDLATMESANEAARRAVNGILAASESAMLPCPVWELHEPELFAPWRTFDAIRYAQGLPWDDSLVRLGVPLALLADRVFHALDENTTVYDAAVAHGVPLPFKPAHLVSIIDRDEDGSIGSALRLEANRLFERLGGIVARRLAELQSSDARVTEMAAGERVVPVASSRPRTNSRSGRVELLPR
jgi:uncharacterized protein with NAD-binding domain and iron-sulfur cluster